MWGCVCVWLRLHIYECFFSCVLDDSLLPEADLLCNAARLVPEWVAYVPQHFSSVVSPSLP